MLVALDDEVTHKRFVLIWHNNKTMFSKFEKILQFTAEQMCLLLGIDYG